MKRLFGNITVFLIPVLIGLYFLPLNERRKFEGLVNDCENRGIWMHDRLFLNTSQPVDIAFIGSSHTINGVDDQLISDSLRLNVLNLGYCRLGRNLQYSLLKKLLETRKPKLVILEIDRVENAGGHPVFPFIADSKDVLFADGWLNRGYFSDAWLHFTYKLETFQDELYVRDTTVEQSSVFGHGASAEPADAAFLRSIAQQRRTEGKGSLINQYARSTFAMDYVGRMAQLCKKNDVRLKFLFLPGYGTTLNADHLRKQYVEFGPVLFPPHELLNNPFNWHDEDHLNQRGAEQLSEWLQEVLKAR